jgi:hypothetical protein
VLETFTVDTFAGRVGETFRVHDDSGDLEMQLASAETTSERRGTGRAPFSLVFVGPLEPVLPQRIYPFEHDGLGAFELFIVPIGPNESGMQYEAVFT